MTQRPSVKQRCTVCKQQLLQAYTAQTDIHACRANTTLHRIWNMYLSSLYHTSMHAPRRPRANSREPQMEAARECEGMKQSLCVFHGKIELPACIQGTRYLEFGVFQKIGSGKTMTSVVISVAFPVLQPGNPNRSNSCFSPKGRST